MLSEGQRNDCNFAIPVLKHVHLEGCNVLADRGYNSDELIDYIYTHGAEPTIPSKKNAKFPGSTGGAVNESATLFLLTVDER